MSGESDIDLMRRVQPMLGAPRCTARSKRSGQRCKGPAVVGWTVCRMHGARSGGPAGEQNGRWRHGLRSATHRARMRHVRTLLAEVSDVVKTELDG